MAAVEFVYERSCPHVRDARARLIEAFRAAGLRPSWTEWEINEPATPERVRPLGSPTILVDGKDVSGLPLEEVSSCCRIYALEGHERGGRVRVYGTRAWAVLRLMAFGVSRGRRAVLRVRRRQQRRRQHAVAVAGARVPGRRLLRKFVRLLR